jgi:type 1 glutamine amidotransferase/HEAT repeat protein
MITAAMYPLSKYSRLVLFCAGSALLSSLSWAAPGQEFPPLTAAEVQSIDQALPAAARVQPKQPRRLLVFYRTEGFVHQSIPVGNHAFVRLGEATGAWTAELSDDMASFDPQNLQRFDAVVFHNTTRLAFADPKHRQALLDFARRGKGVAGIHAGSDNFYDWPEGQALIGGIFHNHPWNARDTVAVKIDEPAHPVVAAFGGQGFWIREEIYQIVGPYSRERQRVLLSLDMSKPENARPADRIVREDQDFPISWIKQEGKGRVFYSSLGHNKEIFSTPEVLQHFLDGLQFALGDLPADAIPSARLSPAPEPALAPATARALQDRVSTAALADALAALAAYDFGDDRAALLVVENFLRQRSAAAAASALQQPLLDLIASPTAAAGAKDFAWRTLGQIGTPAALPALAAMLRSPEQAIPAVQALSTIQGPQAEAALLAALGSIHPSARLTLVDALGRRRVAAAARPLADLARSSDRHLALAAINALSNLGTDQALAALNRLPRNAAPAHELAWARLRAAQTLAATQPAKASSSLHRLVAPTEPAPVRVAALHTIATVYGARAWPRLAPMISDPERLVRLAAAKAPATIGDAAVIRSVASLLPQLDTETAEVFIASLATAPPAAAREALGRVLQLSSDPLQLAAVRAFGSVGDASSLPALLPLLAATGPLADAAAASLAAIADPSIDQQLLQAASSSSGATKAVLLTVLGSRLYTPATAAAFAATDDEDSSVRQAAYQAAGTLAGPSELPALLDLLDQANAPAERRAVQRALTIAFANTADASAAARLAGARLPTATGQARQTLVALLASLESPIAVSTLAADLASASPDGRKEIIRAWSSARNQAARPHLLASAQSGADEVEKVLSLRGLLDLVRENGSLNSDQLLAEYQLLWPLATRADERDAILSGAKGIRNHPASAQWLASVEEALKTASP